MGMTPETSTSATPQRTATSRELLSVLFRRKWLILGILAVTTITVISLSASTPTTFASSGRVQVLRGERQSALSPNRQMFSDWEEAMGGEMEVAKSVPVLQRARDILKAETEQGAPPVTLEVGSVDLEVIGKSNVMGIGYVHSDGVVARRICNALITAYVEFSQSRLTLGRPESFFEAELTEVDQAINRKLEARRAYAMSSGVNDPDEQGRAWADQLAVMQQRHNQALMDLAEAEISLRSMRELEKDPNIDLPTLGMPFSNEAALVSLKQKIVDQQGRIAILRERYLDDAAEVQSALGTLETLQDLLKREVAARLTMAESRNTMLRARVRVIEQDMEPIKLRLAAVPGGKTSLDELDSEIATLRSRYAELARARDQTRITANTSQERTVILLSPAGPATPVNTRDYVRLALAPAFSLVIGIGLAFFLDGLDLAVRTPSQAEEYLELPVMASLGERPGRR